MKENETLYIEAEERMKEISSIERGGGERGENERDNCVRERGVRAKVALEHHLRDCCMKASFNST